MWGPLFNEDFKEQAESRKEYSIQCVELNNRPRMIYYSESESSYTDHDVPRWEEMSGKQLNSAEAVAARLDEIKLLHSFNVYDKVSIEGCWNSTGRGPVHLKWVEISKGDSINHDGRSRLVARGWICSLPLPD